LRNLRHQHKLRLQQVRSRLRRHSRRPLLTFRQGKLQPLGSLQRSNRQRLDKPQGSNPERLNNLERLGSLERLAQ
jgi:hypothetical protein